MEKIQKTTITTESNKPTEEKVRARLEKILEEQFKRKRLIKITPVRTLISDYVKECS